MTWRSPGKRPPTPCPWPSRSWRSPPGKAVEDVEATKAAEKEVEKAKKAVQAATKSLEEASTKPQSGSDEVVERVLGGEVPASVSKSGGVHFPGDQPKEEDEQAPKPSQRQPGEHQLRVRGDRHGDPRDHARGGGLHGREGDHHGDRGLHGGLPGHDGAAVGE